MHKKEYRIHKMDTETRARVRKALKPYKPYYFFYKDETFLINFNPRKGKCLQCGATDKQTELHHTKYDDDHPLDNTIELCNTCHGKITYQTTIAPISIERAIEIFQRTGRKVKYHSDLK